MRNGSAALVPLFLAIMLLFWAIMFLGGASDTQKSVNDVENLNHLQTKLLLSALKYRYEQAKADPSLSDAQLTENANTYINNIMVLNKIQK